MLVSRLDEAAADGQSGGDDCGVIEGVAPVGNVAVRGSHGGVFIGHSGRFAVRAKLRDDLRAGSPLEPFLLRAPPWLGRGGARYSLT